MSKHWTPNAPGTHVFVLRLNAPVSLSDSPYLSTEIQSGKGWERVALEAPDDSPGAVDELLTKLEKDPVRQRRVMGTLVQRVVPWGHGHHSRILIVLDINPTEAAPIPEALPTPGT